jgi:hypothetical protein
MRAIDQGRFTSRPIGYLKADEIRRIEDGIRNSIGLA